MLKHLPAPAKKRLSPTRILPFTLPSPTIILQFILPFVVPATGTAVSRTFLFTQFEETNTFTTPPQNIPTVAALEEDLKNFLDLENISPILEKAANDNPWLAKELYKAAKSDPWLAKELNDTIPPNKYTSLAYTVSLTKPLKLKEDLTNHFLFAFNSASMQLTLSQITAVGSTRKSPHKKTPFPLILNHLINEYVRQKLGDQFNLFYYNDRFYVENPGMSKEVCKVLNRTDCPTLKKMILIQKDPVLLSLLRGYDSEDIKANMDGSSVHWKVFSCPIGSGISDIVFRVIDKNKEQQLEKRCKETGSL